MNVIGVPPSMTVLLAVKSTSDSPTTTTSIVAMLDPNWLLGEQRDVEDLAGVSRS